MYDPSGRLRSIVLGLASFAGSVPAMIKETNTEQFFNVDEAARSIVDWLVVVGHGAEEIKRGGGEAKPMKGSFFRHGLQANHPFNAE